MATASATGLLRAIPSAIARTRTINWSGGTTSCTNPTRNASAALIGVRYGHNRYRAADGRKSVEGSAAFFVVAAGVMILRVKDANRPRPFRTPLVWVVGPLAMIGCTILFLSLDHITLKLFAGWTVIGVIVYALYGMRKSALARAAA